MIGALGKKFLSKYGEDENFLNFIENIQASDDSRLEKKDKIMNFFKVFYPHSASTDLIEDIEKWAGL